MHFLHIRLQNPKSHTADITQILFIELKVKYRFEFAILANVTRDSTIHWNIFWVISVTEMLCIPREITSFLTENRRYFTGHTELLGN